MRQEKIDSAAMSTVVPQSQITDRLNQYLVFDDL